MNANNVHTSSTSAPGFTLRPRTNRLISGLSEGDEANFDADADPPRRIPSPLPSPLPRKPASPLPSAHPQRSASSHGPARRAAAEADPGSRPSARQAQLGGQTRMRNESPKTLAGIWGSSWNTLQGLAADLMAGEAAGEGAARDKPGRQRGPLSRISSPRSGSPAGQWGPTSKSEAGGGIASGTREEREAMVRAEKRKKMLLRQESSYADALGKFKRRLSDDHESMSAPPGENDDRSALVYLHHVKRDDTLAGITIRYNISANILRRANRMWPNDTVQSRNTLTLPVDACGVKGKVIPNGQALDLLGSESDALAAGQAEEVEPQFPAVKDGKDLHNRTRSNSANTASMRPSSSVAGSSVDSDQPWHHDSWVLLPGNEQPIEIARLSRRALGYFPPARRKSISFSDLDTPSTSLDLARSTSNHNDQPSSAAPASSTVASPLRSTSSAPRPHRRRPSNAENGYYPSFLAGPGGVGTMNKNVHYPGPAQDGLNKMFARYFADVAPPRNQTELYQPDMPLHADQNPPRSGTSTPPNSGRNAGFVSAGNLNLESVGGQIESWVRRMAKHPIPTPTLGPGQSQKSGAAGAAGRRGPRTSVGTPGMGAEGVGDLIEMTDEFEIGEDEDEEDEEEVVVDEQPVRGRQERATFVGVEGNSGVDYSSGNNAVATTARGRGVEGGKRGKAD